MPQYIRKLVLKHEDESLEQYETRVNKELEKLENYSEDESTYSFICNRFTILSYYNVL